MNALIGEISGPFVHENLAVFLLRGPDRIEGDAYLTLSEVIDSGKLLVHETGQVRELLVESLFEDKDVFIQSGEMLRGGRQDRTIGVDFIVPPKSGKLPIPSFCVEQGRWTERGNEPVRRFTSPEPHMTTTEVRSAAYQKDQSAIWSTVRSTQERLERTYGVSVRSPLSPSSLELTYDHERVRSQRTAYTEAISRAIDDTPDAVGAAFAVNGRLRSVEIYASRSLFRRLWPKLVTAASIDAMEAFNDPKAEAPITPDDIRGFVETAGREPIETHEVGARVTVRLQRTRTPVHTRVDTRDTVRPADPLHVCCLAR